MKNSRNSTLFLFPVLSLSLCHSFAECSIQLQIRLSQLGTLPIIVSHRLHNSHLYSTDHMSFATLSRTAMQRLTRGSRTSTGVSRRGLATHEPEVSWGEYRSGKKTFAEWVDANRHIVAGGFFAFYVSLAVYKFRPGPKGKDAKEEVEVKTEETS